MNRMTDRPLVRTLTQAGMVVRDMEKALAEFTHKRGVGPWLIYPYAPSRLTGKRTRWVETTYSLKLARSIP